MKKSNLTEVNQNASTQQKIPVQDKLLANLFHTVVKLHDDPINWFAANHETIAKFLEPIFEKYRDSYEQLRNEEECLQFSSGANANQFPLLYSFCRDCFDVFKDLWEYYKADRINLYYAYYERVVMNGCYNSGVTPLVECLVFYPILSLLANREDGDPINFWIYYEIVTKEEWEDLKNDSKEQVSLLKTTKKRSK